MLKNTITEEDMSKNIAIVGATGAVGLELIKTLEKREFPVKNLKLLASKRSAGTKLKFRDNVITVEELKKDSFKNIDISLFSAGKERSFNFAKHSVDSGAVVVDNSSAFRMDEDVPLVVPEINAYKIKEHNGIIANPNCTAIVTLMSVFPLLTLAKIKRLVVSSYQAVSGSGIKAISELNDQITAYVKQKPIKPSAFQHQIFLNLFSHDSQIDEQGYNGEEIKYINEIQKILDDEKLKISITCVRVPVMRAHSVSVYAELDKSLDLNTIKDEYVKHSSLKVIDDRENNHFPMPIEADSKDEVFVGRFRKDLFDDKVVTLFASGDQLLKGAALNAIQIAETLI